MYRTHTTYFINTEIVQEGESLLQYICSGLQQCWDSMTLEAAAPQANITQSTSTGFDKTSRGSLSLTDRFMNYVIYNNVTLH